MYACVCTHTVCVCVCVYVYISLNRRYETFEKALKRMIESPGKSLRPMPFVRYTHTTHTLSLSITKQDCMYFAS